MKTLRQYHGILRVSSCSKGDSAGPTPGATIAHSAGYFVWHTDQPCSRVPEFLTEAELIALRQHYRQIHAEQLGHGINPYNKKLPTGIRPATSFGASL